MFGTDIQSRVKDDVTVDERVKMVQPQWVRLLHKNGKFAGELNGRGVIRFVDRGGTVEYDLPTLLATIAQDNGEIDTTATPSR